MKLGAIYNEMMSEKIDIIVTLKIGNLNNVTKNMKINPIIV